VAKALNASARAHAAMRFDARIAFMVFSALPDVLDITGSEW
jgi:hypothetical protein